MSQDVILFQTEAQLFEVDPSTKKSWRPSASEPVVLQITCNNTTNVSSVIALEKGKIVLSSTLMKPMTFKKASPKFGQWEDATTRVIHGINFASEEDVSLFIHHFERGCEKKVESATVSVSDLSDKGMQARALYDFNGTDPTQLSFKTGQIIVRVVTTKANAWLEGTIVDSGRDRSGVFPKNYVEILSSTSPPRASGHSMDASSICSGDIDDNRVPSSVMLPYSSTASIADNDKDVIADLRAKVDYLTSQLNIRDADSQLRAENVRLKKALSDSSANVKAWQMELQVLKNNNSRLLTALQESFGGVEVWKAQLMLHQEQNNIMSKKISELASLSTRMNRVLCE